jgi:UTP--glucose-1-phosphate uridylyltransferase
MTDANQPADPALVQCVAKMRAAGIDPVAVDVFSHYHALCRAGATGIIPEDSIRPLLDPPTLDAVDVPDADATAALARTVIIKLNGGLGTSMGLDAAKTLLPVRDGRNFLDLIVEQVRHVRRTRGVRLPLLFMNSFRTRDDTLAHLARYPDLPVEGLPLDFLQNREPKLRADDLTPVEWPADPELEWCPPGHGDLYTALWGSGLLDALLERGFRYASVANGDNLGAAPDGRLAGWFAATGAPYAAEVCTRTPNDRKGGHLAIRRSDGRLILRDSAQTADADQRFFADETVHPYFHANNLWFDLAQLRDALVARRGLLGLPLIRNVKTVDPTDPASPRVIQLESAMGAAIEVFDGARAIAVGRDRFLPVKTTNELLLLRSDVFALGDDGRLTATAAIPEIDLAARYYRLVDDFEERVRVVPSLRRATSLVVRGDWVFDAPAEVVGAVVLPDEGGPRHFR